MEEEIPQGLELIMIGWGDVSFILDDNGSAIRKRVLFSSSLRLVVGYMFLVSLFTNVMQSSDVLGVFFDVLALQFVESLDDVVYGLAKRGFFGGSLMRATTKCHSLQIKNGDNLGIGRGVSSNSSNHRFARGVYYFNGVALLAGAIVVGVKQHNGSYRCKTLTVTFPEEMLEKVYVGGNGIAYEERTVHYPSFNGVYYQDGLFNGKEEICLLKRCNTYCIACTS